MDIPGFGRAATGLAADADAVGIIHKENCMMFAGNLNQPVERGKIPFHAEHAVRRDDPNPVSFFRVLCKLACQIVDRCMRVDLPVRGFRAAQPLAVDDACMVEPVGIDSIPVRCFSHRIVGDGREKRLVGRPARREQDGIFGPQELRNLLFQRQVDTLRPANESNRRDAVAIVLDAADSGLADSRVVG